MTYSEKLKDRRWIARREEFANSRWDPNLGICCDECGEDTQGWLEVHHKRYIRGREPWEYDDADLRLLCESCHGRIHDVEQRLRRLILTLCPHECHEGEDFVEEMERASQAGCIKHAFAHAKNAVRAMVAKRPALGILSMDELEERYIEHIHAGQ